MSIRETAIENASNLAQTIWEDIFSQCRVAYYVERNGRITRDQFSGNAYERQSVYFNEIDHALRAFTIGLNGVGYNGDTGDYSDNGGKTVCDWRTRDIENPANPLIDFIEAIETGFFPDER